MRYFFSVILLLTVCILSCEGHIECGAGERTCEGNVSKSCVYGQWRMVECKDAAPVCDVTHGCIKATTLCGNGVIEGDEMCDGQNLNGRSCSDLQPGYSGVLKCTEQCLFDISGCYGDSGGCEENSRRCASEIVEICQNGKYHSMIDCGKSGKVCGEMDGVVSCVEPE